MQKGAIRPTKVHWQDIKYDFHRHFGTAVQFQQTGYSPIIKDQNGDSRPSACTSYAVTTLCERQDGTPYSHDYQFMKTLVAEKAPPTSDGADARVALSIACSSGVLPTTLQPRLVSTYDQAHAADPANWPTELDSETIIKPTYHPVSKVSGMDWFDSVRSALTQGIPQKMTVYMATQWSADFETLTVATNHILPDSPSNLYWGHAYEAFDWVREGGIDYLLLGTWQGDIYGVCKMSRTLCNQLLGTWGAYAGVINRDAVDVTAQKVTIIQRIIALLTQELKNAYMGYRDSVVEGFISALRANTNTIHSEAS